MTDFYSFPLFAYNDTKKVAEHSVSFDYSGLTQGSMLWGKSKSKIKLKINTENSSSDLTEKIENESELKGLFIKTQSLGYSSSEGVLSPLFINIDYVDLRCDFRAAVSIFEHDIFHYMHDEKKDLKRHLFFAGMKEDAKYEKFYSAVDEGLDSETSIKTFKKPLPEEMTVAGERKVYLKLDDTPMIVMPIDLFIMPQSTIRNPPSYLQSSCAYDAMSGEIIFHINGGYAQGSFFDTEKNGRVWADFMPTDKSSYIDNHQISFYLIDLG